jgi:hypothetical protein
VTSRAAPQQAGPGALARRIAALATAVLVALLALSSPLGQYWSDSQFLVTNAVSWKPYYNALYLPLGHGLWWLLSACAVPLPHALTWLSALALGALAGAVALWPGPRRHGLWVGPAAALLMASSPAAWFHGTVIEVHLVGGLGAAVGWWLAFKAHGAPRPRANLLLCLALLITVAAHLSQVLWLPGMIYLAFGRQSAQSVESAAPAASSAPTVPQAKSLPRGAGLSRRGAWLVALLLLALVVAGVLMVQAGTAAWALRAEVVWLGTLFEFGRLWLNGLATRGFYSLQEVLGYLAAEWLGPQCLLLSALPLTLLAWRRLEPTQRRLARATLLGALLPMLVLSQGGIFERGGYFAAALLPLGWLAAASSAALLRAWTAPVLLALAIGQAILAERARLEFQEHWEDPLTWAAAVAPPLAPGDQVLVASLAQDFALRAAAPSTRVWDLSRQLDMLPARAQAESLRTALATRLTTGVGRVFIDRSLLDAGALGTQRAQLIANQLADPRLQQPLPALVDSGGRLLELVLKPAPPLAPGFNPVGNGR